MSSTQVFEAERPRLVSIAARVLADHAEAEDIVQQAWLRLHGTETRIDNAAAWLTTVTTRLCLDRLRARTPTPEEDVETPVAEAGPEEAVAMSESVGQALHVVLDRLSPPQRVAFVLHDSFGVEFSTIAEILDTTPAAARKLASRARTIVSKSDPGDVPADWHVVDAFMAAARAGEFDRLLSLLAPEATVAADAAAILAGTPDRIDNRQAVAEFFNGSAHAALAVLVADRAGYAWYHRGQAMVVFDFAVSDGLVRGITFRAEPQVLDQVTRRQPSGHI